jgi:hypothetical protein
MRSRAKKRLPMPLNHAKIRMARVAVAVAGVAVVVVGLKKARLAVRSRKTTLPTLHRTLPKRPQNPLKRWLKTRLLKSHVAGQAAPRLLTSPKWSKHR